MVVADAKAAARAEEAKVSKLNSPRIIKILL